jgi:hypothetical protein
VVLVCVNVALEFVSETAALGPPPKLAEAALLTEKSPAAHVTANPIVATLKWCNPLIVSLLLLDVAIEQARRFGII